MSKVMRSIALSLVGVVVIGVAATAATARTDVISATTGPTAPLATAIDDPIFQTSQRDDGVRDDERGRRDVRPRRRRRGGRSHRRPSSPRAASIPPIRRRRTTTGAPSTRRFRRRRLHGINADSRHRGAAELGLRRPAGHLDGWAAEDRRSSARSRPLSRAGTPAPFMPSRCGTSRTSTGTSIRRIPSTTAHGECGRGRRCTRSTRRTSRSPASSLRSSTRRRKTDKNNVIAPHHVHAHDALPLEHDAGARRTCNATGEVRRLDASSVLGHRPVRPGDGPAAASSSATCRR